MAYVATRQSYNFAHWIPHNFIRNMGVPYETLLWGEQNADTVLHFFGAMIITLLIHGSKLPFFKTHTIRIFIFVCFVCLVTEILQLQIGRGFDYLDLLLGILGCFMAYLAINHKN